MGKGPRLGRGEGPEGEPGAEYRGPGTGQGRARGGGAGCVAGRHRWASGGPYYSKGGPHPIPNTQ